MESYLDHAPCYYFSTTDDGYLIDVNQTLCSALGYRLEELKGQKVDTIFTLSTRIFHQTHFFPLLKMQGFVHEIFITLQSKTKVQIPVLLNASRQQAGTQTIILHVGILVEHRKKFEDELIAAKKAAELALNESTALLEAKKELQKNIEQLDEQMRVVSKQNAELKEFNRVATHDLQEPLRKLSVFAHMLIDINAVAPAQKKIVERLINVSNKMRLIVSDLQQYLWLTEGTLSLKKIDLRRLIGIVSDRLRAEFPRVQLSLEMEESPLELQADWNQFDILFYQLLENVIRFRKEEHKAHVHISVNHLILNKLRNIGGKYKYSNYLKLEITDRGIGFEPEYSEQVFGLFKKLHTVSGRGMGLSLCKKVVENHQGQISISSKPDEGTTVTILLPHDPVNEVV